SDAEGEPPRVDAVDPDHASSSDGLLQRTGGPPGGRSAAELPNDEPSHLYAARLGVVRIHAVVALMGRGHGDDLIRVRRIRQHLLVTGHGRVEDGFPGRLSFGAERPSPKRRPVLEDHQRRTTGGRHRVASPSCTVKLPRRRVCTTRPRTFRSVNAEFRAMLAKGRSPTVHSAAGSNTTRLAGRPGAM